MVDLRGDALLVCLVIQTRPVMWRSLAMFSNINSDIWTVRRTLGCSVNPGIGKCGNVCGDRVRRQNPLGKNVTNFTKSYDLNWARLTK